MNIHLEDGELIVLFMAESSVSEWRRFQGSDDIMTAIGRAMVTHLEHIQSVQERAVWADAVVLVTDLPDYDLSLLDVRLPGETRSVYVISHDAAKRSADSLIKMLKARLN